MSALILLAALLGCQGEEPECIDNGNCDVGEVCYNETCVIAECTASDQCEIGQFCDPVNYRCRDGCEHDTDCLSGQTCNAQSHACVDAGCRNTELDCPVGTLCDAVTGSCYEPTPPVCVQECDVAGGNSCARGTTCSVSSTAETCRRDADCEQGWSCDRFTDGNSYCHKDYCMPTCQVSADDPGCPAGFACFDDGLGGGVCVADCVWLEEGGYL